MRLLIVEDEKDIRDFLQKSLEAEYFVVDTAADGQSGLFLAQTNHYDLIMLDNVMPLMTGLEVCRKLRQDGNTTPILMLSVKTEVGTKVELLNTGADDYLTKPFSVSELVARIRALLRRGEKMQKEMLTISDLVIDIGAHTVCCKDQEINLTKKEFILLEYLVKNKGSAVSRAMILEHVWDKNADPFSNTIESHIRSLRKKLETEQRKFIHTIPGIGYKISD